MESLVAVAVTVRPTETAVVGVKVREALPDESVVTLFWPMNFLPSSPERFEKNSIVKILPAVLPSVPLMVVLPETVLAEVSTGVFCTETDATMPSPPLEKIELREIRRPVLGPETRTPSPPLKAMVFEPAAVPSPIWLFEDPASISTPLSALPKAPVPLAGGAYTIAEYLGV